MKTEFLVGKALRPRGLKGEIRFELYTGDPSRFRSIKHLRLGDTTFDVEKISVEGDFAYIKFAGIDTVESAETYRGKSLYALRSELPKLKGDRVTSLTLWAQTSSLTVTALGNLLTSFNMARQTSMW